MKDNMLGLNSRTFRQTGCSTFGIGTKSYFNKLSWVAIGGFRRILV
jgi:hypothetical protein